MPERVINKFEIEIQVVKTGRDLALVRRVVDGATWFVYQGLSIEHASKLGEALAQGHDGDSFARGLRALDTES